MIRTAKQPQIVALVALVGLALVPAPSQAGPIYPPTASVNGKTFEEWNVLWSQKTIEDALAGGSSIGDVVNGVRLLPNNTSPGAHEFSVTLLAGTPFVDSPFFVYGERYSDPNVPDDTPQMIIDLDAFGSARITTTLDGVELMNGTGTDLADYMFGPKYFDSPIVYSQPQYRFDDGDGNPVYATSALFVQGIGSVFRPLAVGEHTLRNTLSSPLFGDFDLTYHITVVPEPASLVMMGAGALGVWGLGRRRRRCVAS